MSGLVCDSRKINSECVSQMDAWADTQILFNSSAIAYGQTQTNGASMLSPTHIQLQQSNSVITNITDLIKLSFGTRIVELNLFAKLLN